MGTGSGFGKAILFGEHFVIYEVPGIVTALSQTVNATVTRTRGEGIHIADHRVGASGYTQKKQVQQRASLERIFRHFGLGAPTLEIVLEGDLPAFSGIGASSASSVAIVRALSQEYGLELTDEQVNAAAREAEKAYHGERTAGLDNVASTYGGLIFFAKARPLTFEKLTLGQPVELVMADTGIVADTKEMIEGVAQRRQKNPVKYEGLFSEARQIIRAARDALLKADFEEVGILMNENHRLLQAIEVTCPELDRLAAIARNHGALGAKQTGGGGGGCIVALTPGRTLQENVAQALISQGFSVLEIRLHEGAV